MKNLWGLAWRRPTFCRQGCFAWALSFTLSLSTVCQGEIGRGVQGEFDRQDALMVACHDLVHDYPEFFAEIARQTHRRVPLLALVNDVEEYRLARAVLGDGAVPSDHVRFMEIPHDTMWVRDYGPMVLHWPGESPVILDAIYDTERAMDDRVPQKMAGLVGWERVPVPVVIEGGNLLFNGRGLAITAGLPGCGDELTDEECDRLLEIAQDHYGIRELVVLENMVGEPTGHVDMFATFTSPNTVVVGRYDRDLDPVNADVLDRNADRLSRVETGQGFLQVLRVPMPPRTEGLWRSYTNVVYANGVLLVPVYPGVDLRGQGIALEMFRRALPGWEVIGVDASGVIQSGGALHCSVMNLGAVGILPEWPEPSGLPRRQEEPLDDVQPGDGRMHGGFRLVVTEETAAREVSLRLH